MKKFLLIAFASLAVLASACKKNDGGSSSPGPADTNYATTPQPCNNTYYSNNPQYCVNGQPTPWFQQQMGNYQYQPWYTNGMVWPQNWNPNIANCGCPTGSYSVFTPYYGVACAPAYNYQMNFYMYWNWGWNYGMPVNNQWLNMPQMQYQSYNTNNCLTQSQPQTAVGCDVRTNNCGSGYMCVPISGGSTVGTCRPR